MSKMIDTVSGASVKKHVYDSDIHSEIAKTYFQSPPKKPVKKPGRPSMVPWLVAVCAIIVAAVIVLSRSSIDIKIKFFGEIPAITDSSGSRPDTDKGEFLIKGGEPNSSVIKNAFFSGDAKNFSVVRQDEVNLCNSRGNGWANYTLELKDAVDLNKLEICYTAKGLRGDETLLLVIVDSNNRSYRLEKDLTSALSGDWRKYRVNFRQVKRAVDLENISKIKFEFGSLTAGNYPSAAIYLKDIYITKTRRLKWL